jgi:Flp pilus assembly protein TadG
MLARWLKALERHYAACAHFRCDRRGNVAMLTAVMVPAILGLSGLAIDLQFTVRQKEKVQAALDSAILSGALERQAGKSEANVGAGVNTYFNGLINAQGGGLSCTPVTVRFGQEGQDIRGTLQCTQPTFLSSVFGGDELTFNVRSTSTYGVGKIDVAFIFDVSGSMNSDNRLPLLKSAAVDAFDILLPDDAVLDGTIRIGITTYNHAANAGPYFNAVTRSQTLSADASNTAAKNNYNAHRTAQMIDSATNKRFFYFERGTCTSSPPCNRNSTYTWNVRRRFFNDVLPGNTCVAERLGTQAYSDAAPGANAWITAGNPLWNFSASSKSKYDGWQEVDNGGANDYSDGAFEGRNASCRASAPVPLTETKATLVSHVNGLTADGGTAGHLGIAWGWYLVSPNWAGVWPTVSRPWNYDEPEASKVVILMTDGDFNTSHSDAASGSFQQSQSLCDQMKANPRKIQIFTVGFQVPEGVQRTGDGKTILEYCASTPGHVFNADNGEELAAAYRTIAQSISDLRIKE